MAVTYATAQNLVDFLQLPDAIGVGSTPSQSILEERINEAEDEIDKITSRAWRTRYSGTSAGADTTGQPEYHDIEFYYQRSTGIPIYLTHLYVKTFASGSGDKIEIWNGSEWADWLDGTKTEGRNGDYWVRYEEGVFYLRNWTWYKKGIRITYRYGESTVPKDIKKATILLAAIDLIESDDRSVILPEGTDQLPFTSKVDLWQKKADKLLEPYTEWRLPSL